MVMCLFLLPIFKDLKILCVFCPQVQLPLPFLDLRFPRPRSRGQQVSSQLCSSVRSPVDFALACVRIFLPC